MKADTPLRPVPTNSADERARLAALESLSILDTPPEARFERIAGWAAELFTAPIALVSLIDEDRQWFKSCRGIDIRETPRAVAFCDHTIRGDQVFVVHDASKHVDFQDNPLVTGAPHIRFYAGAPVTTSGGFRVGTVCVIDDKPRLTVSEGEIRMLGLLADMAAAECEERPRDVPEASHAAEERSVLLRTLSHELRTPLNAILGFTDMLVLGHAGALDPRQASYLNLVQGAARNLIGFLDEIMLDAETPGQGRKRRRYNA